MNKYMYGSVLRRSAWGLVPKKIDARYPKDERERKPGVVWNGGFVFYPATDRRWGRKESCITSADIDRAVQRYQTEHDIADDCQHCKDLGTLLHGSPEFRRNYEDWVKILGVIIDSGNYEALSTAPLMMLKEGIIIGMLLKENGE